MTASLFAIVSRSVCISASLSRNMASISQTPLSLGDGVWMYPTTQNLRYKGKFILFLLSICVDTCTVCKARESFLACVLTCWQPSVINSTQLCCHSYRSETSADWLELLQVARGEARVSGWVENRSWMNQQSVRMGYVTALWSHVTDQRYCGIHWTTCWTWSDYGYLKWRDDLKVPRLFTNSKS